MSPYAKAAAYMGLAMVTPISGWICYKIGQWLMVRTETPWLDVLGLMIGCAAGIYETFMQAMKIEGLDKKQ